MNKGHSFSNDYEGARAAGVCARAGDLLAYLYDEATAVERMRFTQHLDSCAACRDELAAFGGVRERVGAWREEVLRAAPRVDLSGALSQEAPQATHDTPARRRSARAALREFFALSPAWLRAATAAAALAVCALAALALARTEVRWDGNGVAIRAGLPSRTTVERVEVPAGALTKQQADELAQRRVEEALEAERAEFARELEHAVASARAESQTSNRPAPLLVNEVGQTPRGRPAVRKRPSSRGLEDVRSEDEGLPGLYDLLREAN